MCQLTLAPLRRNSGTREGTVELPPPLMDALVATQEGTRSLIPGVGQVLRRRANLMYILRGAQHLPSYGDSQARYPRVSPMKNTSFPSSKYAE